MNFFSAYTLKVKTQTLIFLKYEAFLVICGITELRKKEVINIRNGLRLGFVRDVEIDLCNARIVSIIIHGKLKFFGLFGRHQDIVIKWENVDVVGEDTILVNFFQQKEHHPKGIFSKIFSKKNNP